MNRNSKFFNEILAKELAFYIKAPTTKLGSMYADSIL